MAQYFTDDFADFPGSWTERFNAPTTGTYSVSGGDLTLPSGASSDWTMRSWDDIDGDADRDDVEVLFLGVPPAAFDTTYANMVAVRAAGTDENVSAFAVGIMSTHARMGYIVASDGITGLSQATHGLTITGGSTEVWCRFSITGSGTKTYKVKVWTGAIGDEPGTWLLNLTTANGPDAAGWVGPCTVSSSTRNPWIIKQFGVGTGGDPAPSSSGGGGSATGAAAHYYRQLQG